MTPTVRVSASQQHATSDVGQDGPLFRRLRPLHVPAVDPRRLPRLSSTLSRGLLYHSDQEASALSGLSPFGDSLHHFARADLTE